MTAREESFLKWSQTVTAGLLVLGGGGADGAEATKGIGKGLETSAPEFTVKLEAVRKHDAGDFLGFIHA